MERMHMAVHSKGLEQYNPSKLVQGKTILESLKGKT
jgi:hypothetical protein